MQDAHVHHLPIVEHGLLMGVWVATNDGEIVMLGPRSSRRDRLRRRCGRSNAGADRRRRGRSRARRGASGGRHHALDVLGIVRTAIGRGVGKRHRRRPTVIQLARRRRGQDDPHTAVAGSPRTVRRRRGPGERIRIRIGRGRRHPVVRDPSAHQPAGLDRVVKRLADTQLSSSWRIATARRTWRTGSARTSRLRWSGRVR